MKDYDFVVTQDDAATPDTVEKQEKVVQASNLKEALAKLREQVKQENDPE